jgi:hypothetical protein
MIGPFRTLALVAGMAWAAQGAVGDPGDFDEVHLGVPEGTHVLSVTAVFREKPVWRLSPEEVRVEHPAGSREYTLGYQPNYAQSTILRAASQGLFLSEACRNEIKPLLEAPKGPVPEEHRTAKVYLTLDSPQPKRLTVRTSGGIKLREIRPLHSLGSVGPGEHVEWDGPDRLLFVRFTYLASYYINLGLSDVVTEFDAGTGEARLVPQKAGFAAVKHFADSGRISEGCWKILKERFAGPPTDPGPKLLRRKKNGSALIWVPATAPRAFRVLPRDGLSIESLEALE